MLVKKLNFTSNKRGENTGRKSEENKREIRTKIFLIKSD